MKQIHRLFSVALMLCVCGLAAAADFVGVKGTHFVRDEQPYYIVGANFWYGGYLGVGERARLVKELDNMHALGINNLRVLAVSEKTEMKSAVSPASTTAPGRYDENLLVGLDFLMAEVAKRDMTVVLYLNNFWQWSGGMTQYLNWFEGTPALDPNVTKDYDTYMRKTATFYRNAAAQAEYRKVIASIVKRVNTITGKPYSEDASIMSWQLANEPRPGNGKATADEKAVYVKWIDDTAGYIHTLDKNHLVSSGSEGLAGSARDEQLFLESHKTPRIDYLTYHLWPKNWGWFDSKNPEGSWDGALAKSRDYLNSHIDLAKKLNKPIVLEEFGLDRDGASFSIKATTKIRDRFYREVFEIISQRARKGDPIAGFNFWAWGGAGRAANADYWWKPGNDFVGDPPQEEQGLYSVFDSDVSSLLLIKEYADQLHALGGAIACGTTPAPRVKEHSWMSVARWNELYQAQVAVADKGGVDLLFVGDSITAGWNKQIWDKSFGAWRPANLAIGGDHTGNLLWRLQNGHADKLRPKVVVLLIGVNNFIHCRATPAEAYAGVRAVVTQLRAMYPDARILLNAVLPWEKSAQNPRRAQVSELNRMIARLDDGKRVFFRDYGARFVQPNGDISPEVMADSLHPTAKGYQIWADAMLPEVTELIK